MIRSLLFAIAALATIPVVASESFSENYQAGVAALAQHRLAEARSALERAVELDPGAGAAWIALARTLLELGDPDAAEGAAERAASLSESDPRLAHGVALYYIETGNPALAARFEARFARQTGALKAYEHAAKAFLTAGEPEEAERIAAEGLEIAESGSLHNVRGKALASLGRGAEAEQALRRAIELEPYNEESHYDLGYLFLQAGRFDDAVASFEQSRKTFDKSPRLELGIGVARYGQRRFSEAVDAFLKTSLLAPSMAQPHYFLGEILEHAEHRLAEVNQRFDAFAAAAPDHYLAPFLQAKGRLAMAGLRPNRETMEKVTALLRRSIALRDDFWQAHFELGVALDRQRKWKEAEKALARSVELSPRSPTPHYRLARVYTRLGRPDLAKKHNAEHTRLERELRESLQSGGMSANAGNPVKEAVR